MEAKKLADKQTRRMSWDWQEDKMKGQTERSNW